MPLVKQDENEYIVEDILVMGLPFVFLEGIPLCRNLVKSLWCTILDSGTFSLWQGEWKPRQIDNPAYKGPWVHPEIANPEYSPDENLYRYTDIGAVGFDLWQVRAVEELYIKVLLLHVLSRELANAQTYTGV